MTSLWGDWLPELVAALDRVKPTPEERAILRQAGVIHEAHKQRIADVIAAIHQQTMQPEKKP